MPAFHPVTPPTWDHDTDSNSPWPVHDMQSPRKSLPEVRAELTALRKELSDWQASQRERTRSLALVVPTENNNQDTNSTQIQLGPTPAALHRSAELADDDDRLEFLKQRLARQLGSDATRGAST
ncbi:MAG: hypothetical protein O3C60_10310 [Planctomycetota bacterium]|nr:hypothetical protein [Planctomycetota bacterium]